jgi:hypothetical protein
LCFISFTLHTPPATTAFTVTRPQGCERSKQRLSQVPSDQSALEVTVSAAAKKSIVSSFASVYSLCVTVFCTILVGSSQSIADNVGFCVGAAWYAAQQECDFKRADDEFVSMRSLWLRGMRVDMIRGWGMRRDVYKMFMTCRRVA